MKMSTMDELFLNSTDDLLLGYESIPTIPIDSSDIVAATSVDNTDMNQPGQSPISARPMTPPPPKMLIRRSLLHGKDKEYRIYLQASHRFTGEYVNRLCRFLDTRRTGERVNIYLGSNLHSSQTLMLGSVISSIGRCRAHVTAIAIGNCGVPETMLFAYAHERVMRRYSALTIGGTKDIDTHLPMYRNFFEVFFKRLIQVGIITQEISDKLWKYHDTLMVTATEYNAR